LVFLCALGSLELWGKREQRAVAESIDTLDNGHWLVAEIQGRPRLEKPPLPRWTTSLLMIATGLRDEWLMRLPSALSALGMVAIVFGLGRRIGGREVALASGFALVSLSFFIVEMRQAGNDGPLAFFVSLAVYCAWRRLHGGDVTEGAQAMPCEQLGARRWTIAMYAALGLGFLCKGPVALLLVALALLPYLATARRFKAGCRALANGWGFLLLLCLILSWPVPVLLSDRRALDVWILEMGQKAGTAGITHHRWRGPLAMEWLAMTAPWTVVITLAVVVPLARRGREIAAGVWLVWYWAVLNLLMFCFWSVAKPNYYLPCMPAVAVLGGLGWSWLAQAARSPGQLGRGALKVIRGHWVALFGLSILLPILVGWKWPEYLNWSLAGASVLLLGIASSMWFWQRGANTHSLTSLVCASTILVAVGYGMIGPRFNDLNGHRALATQITRLLPESEQKVFFYNELDEGLWYYLRGRRLVPVLQPRYNKGLDLLDDFKAKRIIWNDQERYKAEALALSRWIDTNSAKSSYMLIKAKTYDFFREELSKRAEPIYREPALERNELVLLRLNPPATASRGREEGERSQVR
jgi:hypothetical protein